MEAAPPSYETATLANPLDLVARYLQSNDLCSAALVCQAWHSVFTPHLWGNPTAHFGSENDRVYIALTKFQWTLPWARKYVRAFTHTLHLPPAHAELYNGPTDSWLRDVLERLDHLQSLIVRGLPFFDHGALTALRPKPSPTSPTTLNTSPSFALRLLDASKCENATSSGLLAALKQLDQLLYLDLSRTYAARDHQVLAQLRNLSGLQVLKLKGISLRDDDVQILAAAVGTRVRSLDVSNNKLTDQSARYLIETCFTNEQDPDLARRRADGERATLLHYLGAQMLRTYQGSGFEGYLRRQLTAGFVARLAFEDTPESGVTHLYIANNNLSVEGLSGLLRTKRLHVFDARADTHLPNKLLTSEGDMEIIYPGSEKLPLVLSKDCGNSLTHFTIDHEIITKKAPQLVSASKMTGRVELPAAPFDGGIPELPPRHVELDSTPVVQELPTTHEIVELPGDHIHLPQPPDPPSSTTTSRFEIEDPPAPRKGSVFAPEPVLASNNPFRDLASPTSTSTTSTTTPSTATLLSPPTPHPNRQRTYSSIRDRRAARHAALDKTTYHPAMTPHLRVLTLTRFPSHSPDPAAADRLVSFLHACATEAQLARAQATLDWSLPPGRRSPAHRREAEQKLFALETVVLEVVSTAGAPASSGEGQQQLQQGGSGGGSSAGWRSSAMTRDVDGEGLWRAAEADFSFFGGWEGGERMFPSLGEEGSARAWVGADEKMVASAGEGTHPALRHTEPVVVQGKKQPAARELVDNIAVLGKFRRERKAEYERRREREGVDVEVEGYWPGTVRVVRMSGREEEDDDDEEAGVGEGMDYYGNWYGKRGVYR